MSRGYPGISALLIALVLLVMPAEPVAGRMGEKAPPDKSDKPAELSAWPAGLPVYDHVVIVVEENKDYDQIYKSPDAPFINELLAKGANFTRMFGEEHNSQGNYFWLFSGSNHGVGFRDGVPDVPIRGKANLGASLIANKPLSFKGYAEDLPEINSDVLFAPVGAKKGERLYARKHVPWISFDNVPNEGTAEESSNLRFEDFPTDFTRLPTVAIVIPNLKNDMHDGKPKDSIPRGDRWLKEHIGTYYQWARTHNSLLIVTFDESDDKTGIVGLTDPSLPDTPANKDARNHTVTVFAGAHIKPGDYEEGKGITHVNILRTLEAMYKLPKAGAQQPNAARCGITDGPITDVFETGK